MIADVAVFLFAAMTPVDSARTGGAPPTSAARAAPSAGQLAQIQASFWHHGEARFSRDGVRTIVSRPRFHAEGIGYEAVIDEAGSPVAQTLPPLVRWSDVDTLWRRNSRAGKGALIGALVVGGAAAAWGYHGWSNPSDAALVATISGVGGAIGGAIVGATIGSGSFVWERVHPPTSHSSWHWGPAYSP